MKKSQVLNFGEHLMIDGYQGSEEKLYKKSLILYFIKEVMKMLRMKQLSKIVIVKAPDNQKKDPGGWSGFVIINESHISIHTFPKRHFVTIDVYSCKNGMAKKKVEKFIKKTFDLGDIEVNFVKRGTKYPKYNL